MERLYLPIALRELRSAARRKSTYRFRWWAALFAMLASFIWFAWLPGSAVSKVANTLFDVQTGCGFLFALFAGAFLTSDGLSEEKRDGTLGLLFLAGLNARDIVLGKFLGAALEATYWLLALLPVTGLALFMGGVGLLEVIRVSLALLNTLILSLTIGLCVSALAKSYARALLGTLALLIFFAAGLPCFAGFNGTTTPPGAWFALGWFSPFLPLFGARDLAYVANPSAFWLGLVGTQVIAWLFLAVAAWRLGDSWVEKGESPPLAPGSHRARTEAERRSRRKLISETFDPVLLFIGSSRFLRVAAWVLVAVCAIVLWLNRTQAQDLMPARACGFVLKILVAFQACRFFVETRQSGALEMLLCTPLKSNELIQAQWRALLRVFLWPLVIFLVLCWAAFAIAPPRLPTTFGPGGPPLISPFFGTFLFSLELAADVLALGWFGMWLGLTVRKPVLAPALTVLAVLILPSMISYFAVVADMFFISWGTTHFRAEFRWIVASLLPKPGPQS